MYTLYIYIYIYISQENIDIQLHKIKKSSSPSLWVFWALLLKHISHSVMRCISSPFGILQGNQGCTIRPRLSRVAIDNMVHIVTLGSIALNIYWNGYALVPGWETRYRSADSMPVIVPNAMVLIWNLPAHDKTLPKCSDSFQFLKGIRSTPKVRNQRDPNRPLPQYREVPRREQKSTTQLLQKHLSGSNFTDWLIGIPISSYKKSYKSNQ